MIAVGSKQAIAVRGDYRPVEINVGGRKVAGWTEQAVEGVTQAEFADTYNDRAQVTVQGERLEQDAEPTPESPQLIHGTEAVVTVSNADTEAVETALPVLYGRDGVCDVLETDVVVDGVHRSRVTRRWWTAVVDGTEGWERNSAYEFNRYQVNSFSLPASAGAPNVFDGNIQCSHYRVAKSIGSDGAYVTNLNNVGVGLRIIDIIGKYADVDALVSFLTAQYAAGTPVTIVYQLAEPIVELGDPIDVRTLPRSTIIGCTDPFSAVVKVVERDA